MATAWVNVPSRRTDTGREPDLGGVAYRRYEGNRLTTSSRFVVRVTAGEAALAELLAQDGVTELPLAAARDIFNEQGPCTIDEASALFD